MNRLANVTIVLMSVLVSVGACASGAESPELWLNDFDTLKSELASGYANLEWAARRANLDLAELNRSTEERLRQASSSRKARKIIIEFLESFNDPHLRAEHSDPPTDEPAAGDKWVGPAATASAKDAIEQFGYKKSKYDFGLDLDAFDTFKSIQANENPFPCGVLEMDDGRRLGVIRIKYFGEDRYYNVAARAWEEFKGEIDGSCDDGCWWPFTLLVRTHLMKHLQTRLTQLREAGADALLVDITGNGGGSEWCEDVAQLFTAKALRARATGFVKHEHWLGEIEREIGWINEDLTRTDLTESIRSMLATSLAEHEALLAAIRDGCDASTVWEEGIGKIACDRLTIDEHPRYAVPDSVADVVETLKSEHLLFETHRHPEFIGLYDGPLFVAIDSGTASASEQFATLLQFNEVATTVGETSYGAGCGYTRGGIKLYLENVKLRVRMSDCVRYRADGENELAGVEPDVAGWDKNDTGKTRARKLIDALRQIDSW